MRAEFERVGGGAVLNNSPYDVAASVLLAEEAGAIVTDARGRALGERLLLGSSAEHQISIIVAANALLHGQIVAAVDSGMARVVTRMSPDP
jgi:myo-inositol-1(or 4)-monophosphatase